MLFNTIWQEHYIQIFEEAKVTPPCSPNPKVLNLMRRLRTQALSLLSIVKDE